MLAPDAPVEPAADPRSIILRESDVEERAGPAEGLFITSAGGVMSGRGMSIVALGLLTLATPMPAQADRMDGDVARAVGNRSGRPERSLEPLGSMTFVSTTAAERPNIVVLILDDVGAHDGRIWGSLPTIKRRFIDNGIAFTDFHGETPMCCPGRVGFLTGLHTHAHRVTLNDGTLFKPSMSIATQLRRSGYYTILGGKYLNEYEDIRRKVPPGWSQFHAFSGGYRRYPLWSNGRREWHGSGVRDYSTDVIARKIVSSLRRAPRNKPVFVWAAPWASHTPIVPADRHRRDDRCDGIPRWRPPGYMERDVSDKPAYVRRHRVRATRGKSFGDICRALLSVDDMLRRITATLRAQGRLERTLFILTADNGMNYGMHRLFLHKLSPYATQLPFFASWPQRIAPGRPPIAARLQNIDLAPTLCDLAGCQLGPYPTGQRRADGRSFAGVLLGQSGPPRRSSVLMSFRTPGKFVPPWHGIETTGRSPLAARGCDLAAEQGCRWSFVRYDTGAVELYDLSNGPCWEWTRSEPGDPCRLQNLAGKRRYRSIEAALRKELAALRRR